MDCCLQNSGPGSLDNVEEVLLADPENAPAAKDDPKRACANCGRASRPVTRKTILLMLKPDRFNRVGESQYRFCSDPECRVVYFTDGEGDSFTTVDLRVRVGIKEKQDPIPLCYCFGFDEADIREEIAVKGLTTIPQRISSLLKEGMCACPARNPSGACCLGDVMKAARRLYASRSGETGEVTG